MLLVKVNCATASGAPGERLFSLALMALNSHRCRLSLSDKKFEQLLLLKYNNQL